MMREWASAYDYSRLSAKYECLISPKKVILGDVNEVTEDCIFTTSESLYKKYKNK
jgi:hypothetical protein